MAFPTRSKKRFAKHSAFNKQSKNVDFIYSNFLGLTPAEFNEEEDDPHTLTKEALVMVEGNHIDSAKRSHNFSRDRILQIVKNTNNFISQGGRVPWQTDHDKKQAANIGDLEGILEARVITEEDLPNPKLRNLVGKMGAFAQLVAKGIDVVSQVVSGRIKTLSPGIDVTTDTIKEISATPQPAIVGLSVFRHPSASADFALTWEEADSGQGQIDAIHEEYRELLEQFWNIATAISQADEATLQGEDPAALMTNAIGGLTTRLSSLFGLGETSLGGGKDTVPKGSDMPSYLTDQQSIKARQAQMSSAGGLALFAKGARVARRGR